MSPAGPVRPHRRSRTLLVTIGSVAILLALGLLPILFGLVRPVMESGSGLGGTDVSGDGLTREAQINMIDQFAPIPTPNEASDIALWYRRFQDWQFEASFVLPAP